MRLTYLVLFICALGLLVGCGPTMPVVSYKTKVVAPEDNLLRDCFVRPPPSREAYKNAGVNATREQAAEQREKLLFDYSGAQLKDTAGCNVRWQELRKWKKEQIEMIKASETNATADKAVK